MLVNFTNNYKETASNINLTWHFLVKHTPMIFVLFTTWIFYFILTELRTTKRTNQCSNIQTKHKQTKKSVNYKHW